MREEAPGDSGALYEHAACGLLMARTDGVIIRANATFLGWVGYTSEEVVGLRRIQDFLTVGGRVFHHTHWLPLLQLQGSVAEVKLDVIRRDGRPLPMLMNAVRRKHADGTFDELAVVVVTDRNKYEQELLKARQQLSALNARLSDQNRRKSEFLATLAHELRNPLTPIRTGLEILRQVELPATAARARTMMQRQLALMVRLIDDLMDISRISSGKVELARAPVSAAQLMEAALESSRSGIESAGHQLSIEMPGEQLWVNADLLRFTQVLSNVLNNAAKYTPRGGRVSFGACREAEWLVIRVRDSGAGIEQAKLASVFEIFAQVDSTLDSAQGGLGIGLALARTLTEMHGGTIAAESEGVGKGSTFVIRLPLVQPEAVPAENPVEKQGPARTLRILVVDDEPDNAESLAMLLEWAGHEVRMARSGHDGIRQVEAFAPEVVFLDIGLPDINGHEVARQLRANPAHRKLVLAALTGWGALEDRSRSEAAGFDRHFTKPPAPELLYAFLAECAAGS